MSTTESLVIETPQDVADLKAYYEKEGKLKAYLKEFRIARNITEEKVSGLPKRFVPRWCKALEQAGVPGYDAKRIVLADGKALGWSYRAVIEHVPKAWKNSVFSEAGTRGAAVTNEKKRGLAAANESVRRRVARAGGEERAKDIESLARAGRKGGRAVASSYGSGYFSEIGKKAHQEEEPEIEAVLTGELEINTLEWSDRLVAALQKGKEDKRNLILVIKDNRLITHRFAGLPTDTPASPA